MLFRKSVSCVVTAYRAVAVGLGPLLLQPSSLVDLFSGDTSLLPAHSQSWKPAI
jgi:hypothetical protein